MALIVIPARYNSKRFPGKPLVKIDGLPMVVKVYKQATKSNFAQKVIIATDNEKIFSVAKGFNCNVEFTSSTHKSGTDRVAEVAAKYNFKIVVNLQGDEPYIEPELIDNTIYNLQNDKIADIVTPVKKIEDLSELKDENVVKVVFSKENFALYFSRSPIPFYRDKYKQKDFFKHIGLYAFKRESLMKFVSLKESKLEKIEKLEQLRALEHYMKIKVFETKYESIGIDTPEDLKKLLLIESK